MHEATRQIHFVLMQPHNAQAFTNNTPERNLTCLMSKVALHNSFAQSIFPTRQNCRRGT